MFPEGRQADKTAIQQAIHSLKERAAIIAVKHGNSNSNKVSLLSKPALQAATAEAYKEKPLAIKLQDVIDQLPEAEQKPFAAMAQRTAEWYHAEKKKGNNPPWPPRVHFWSVLALAVQQTTNNNLKLKFHVIEVPVGSAEVSLHLWYPKVYVEKNWTLTRKKSGGGSQPKSATSTSSEPASTTDSKAEPKVDEAKQTPRGAASSKTTPSSWVQALTNGATPDNPPNPKVSYT